MTVRGRDPLRRMEVKTYKGPGAADGLFNDWRELTAASACRDLFTDAGWFKCWAGGFGPGNELQVHAAYDAGRLVGVLPTVRSKTRRRPWFSMHHCHADDLQRLATEYQRGNLLPVTQLSPPALLEAGSIRGSWLTTVQDGDAIAEALFASVAALRGWDLMIFPALPADQADTLQRIAAAAGLYTHVGSESFTLLGLVPQAREDYLSSRNRHFRTRLRTAEKKLGEFGAIRIEAHTSSDSGLETARDTLFALAQKSWKEAQRAGQKWFTPQTDRSQQFFSELIDVYSAADNAVIHELYVGDELAASLLSIIVNDRIYALQTFYDQKFAEGSPGRPLIMGLIDWSFHRGLAWVDMNSNSSLTQLFAREPMEFRQAWVFPRRGKPAALYHVLALFDGGIRRLIDYKNNSLKH